MATGHFLVRGRFGEEVTARVFQRELVIGDVIVEGLDHVVAVGGNFHHVVAVVADGICKPDEIQPVHCHPFAEPFVVQEFVQECAVVGFGRGV